MAAREISAVLQVTDRTIERDWEFARWWLRRALDTATHPIGEKHILMTPEEAESVLELFAQARDCPAEQRAQFLALACAGNDAVRAEIESLLWEQAPPRDFLAQTGFPTRLEVLGDTEAKRRTEHRRYAGRLPGGCLTWRGRHGRGLPCRRSGAGSAGSPSN